MQGILQQITLPASRDSWAAFETSAEELIHRHESVIAGRSHAIRLAVDLLIHHLLPEDEAGASAPGLAMLTFFPHEGSVQQLAMEFSCPGVPPGLDTVGAEILTAALRVAVVLEKGVDGSIEVRVARRSRRIRAFEEGEEMALDRLREIAWLLLLARAWRSVRFRPWENGGLVVRLQEPRLVPGRGARRRSV